MKHNIHKHDPLKLGRKVGEDAMFSVRGPDIDDSVQVIRIQDYVNCIPGKECSPGCCEK